MRTALSTFVCFGFVLPAAVAGCGGGAPDSSSEESENSSAELSSNPKDPLAGAILFEKATFGGNGRSCGTCHTGLTGTISPEQIQFLYKYDRHNPIFRSIDSDDGVGNSYTRLLKNATIRITLDLPPNIRLHDNPTAKTFTVNRSTPTMFNTSLFPILMWDARESNLATQALDAVHAHDQQTIEPTPTQLSQIAAFEDTLFTNAAIAKYARGGPPPTLPTGKTASEKRGRAFFNDDAACGSCHSGPMLNLATASSPIGVGAGSPVNLVFAGFEGALGLPQAPDSPNPVLTWDIDCPADDGGFFCGFVCPVFGSGSVTNNVCTMSMPDPGQAIPTANADNTFRFKTPSLWGTKFTAPYFHDNSANTLEDVMAHYDKFFRFMFGFGATPQNGFTAQEQADIIAYMKLL